MAEQPGERGYDAGKKINGRKRHLLVDTLGLVLAVVVHSAGVQDRDGAKLLLPALLNFGWVRKVFADGGYAGELLKWTSSLIPGRGLTLAIIKRNAPGLQDPAKALGGRAHLCLARPLSSSGQRL